MRPHILLYIFLISSDFLLKFQLSNPLYNFGPIYCLIWCKFCGLYWMWFSSIYVSDEPQQIGEKNVKIKSLFIQFKVWRFRFILSCYIMRCLFHSRSLRNVKSVLEWCPLRNVRSLDSYRFGAIIPFKKNNNEAIILLTIVITTQSTFLKCGRGSNSHLKGRNSFNGLLYYGIN